MILFPPAESIQLNPLLESEGGRGRFRTSQPVPVAISLPAQLDGATISVSILTIPAGFITDGASIPRWARPWLDPWGLVALPSILHDYLLTLSAVHKWQADLLFLAALRSQGVPAFQATLMYFAVRTRKPLPH